MLAELALAGGPAADPAAVALMIALAALRREESRGAHCRTDFPLKASEARRSTLRLASALAFAGDRAPTAAAAEGEGVNAARLPTILIEPIVRAALLEDLGRAGDITSDAIAPGDLMTRTAMVARQDGVVAGLDVAALAFRLIDPAIVFAERRPDGARVAPGETVARVEGPARGVLTAERVALNFLSRLSGVASATASLVAAVAGTRARIVCTRKTTPLLRGIEKYAVRAGGGANHRFGLDDAALIKDNHVAIAGGVAEAIARVRAHVGHLVKIEVEVDTLAQLDEALRVGVDAVLLDNMSLEDLGPRGDDDRRPRDLGSLGPRDQGDRARDRRDWRRSHFGRLADAQRADLRYRAGLCGGQGGGPDARRREKSNGPRRIQATRGPVSLLRNDLGCCR